MVVADVKYAKVLCFSSVIHEAVRTSHFRDSPTVALSWMERGMKTWATANREPEWRTNHSSWFWSKEKSVLASRGEGNHWIGHKPERRRTSSPTLCKLYKSSDCDRQTKLSCLPARGYFDRSWITEEIGTELESWWPNEVSWTSDCDEKILKQTQLARNVMRCLHRRFIDCRKVALILPSSDNSKFRFTPCPDYLTHAWIR